MATKSEIFSLAHQIAKTEKAAHPADNYRVLFSCALRLVYAGYRPAPSNPLVGLTRQQVYEMQAAIKAEFKTVRAQYKAAATQAEKDAIDEAYTAKRIAFDQALRNARINGRYVTFQTLGYTRDENGLLPIADADDVINGAA